MYLATTIHITNNTHGAEYIPTLHNLCYHAARMYNAGLYNLRQHFFNTQNYLNYYDNYHIAKNNENYSILYSSTSQQILRLVDRDMNSFFKLLTLKKCGKYSEKVKLPRYKDKNALAMYIIQAQGLRLINGKLRHGLTTNYRKLYGDQFKYIELTLPKNIDYKTIKEVRIIPLYNGVEYNVEIVYNKEIQPKSTAEGVLSIDPGLSNLLTCVSYSNSKPMTSFIIDGGYIKSVNYYYNKQKARLQSMYELTNVSGSTKRMRRLSNGRKNRINNYFNNVVKYLTDYCMTNGIGTIVMGYNEYQKQECNMGKVNNQNYVMIPMHNLRSKLASKCELLGIDLIFQEESYTSKACSLSLDVIPTYSKDNNVEYVFSGKRIKRGLYKSNEGICINADVNGSINIYRKYLTGKSKADISANDIRAFVNRPVGRVKSSDLLSPTSPLL